MKAAALPKITGAGFEKAVIGCAILAGMYVVYKTYTGISDFADSTATSVLDVVMPDANAKVQSNFQNFMKAWNAAGNPAPGSPEESALRQKYGIPLAPGAAPVGD